MHNLQKAILELAQTKNLADLSYRQIGKMITGKQEQPQRIKYHIDRLLKEGYLRFDKKKNLVERVSKGEKKAGIVSIPIVGAASCGPATQPAEEDIEGFLQVSEKFVPKSREGIFALRAVGSSMNKARFNGRTSIEDGDYVLVDSKDRNADGGEYVLAVAGGLANIKKFKKDPSTGGVVLVSESSEDYPPIYLHPEDDLDFFINGKVIGVLKGTSS